MTNEVAIDGEYESYESCIPLERESYLLTPGAAGRKEYAAIYEVKRDLEPQGCQLERPIWSRTKSIGASPLEPGIQDAMPYDAPKPHGKGRSRGNVENEEVVLGQSGEVRKRFWSCSGTSSTHSSTSPAATKPTKKAPPKNTVPTRTRTACSRFGAGNSTDRLNRQARLWGVAQTGFPRGVAAATNVSLDDSDDASNEQSSNKI